MIGAALTGLFAAIVFFCLGFLTEGGDESGAWMPQRGAFAVGFGAVVAAFNYWISKRRRK
jgi:hypothetical protein